MASALSEKQQQLLAAVCEVMKADIDWNRVAEIAEMKTSKYARDQWTIVRNKLMGGKKLAAKDGKDGKATSKKRKVADAHEGGDDDEAPAAKKTVSRKGKKDTPTASDEECGSKKEEVQDEVDEFA